MLYRDFYPLPPLADVNAPGNRQVQRLAGTGTTEDSNSRPLIRGKVHVLYVGAEAVRVRFSGTAALVGAVDPARDVVYGPWSQVPFVPETDYSVYVYAEAADGVSAYECSIVQLQS